MATLTYYTFSKRSKSTAQPTGGTQITVNLKDGTSLISPVFLLNYSGVPTFNYVSFEGRYYFVSDIRSVRQDLWEISCTEDYLATGKTDIGSTTAMILYATGGRNDIIDSRIPIESDIAINNTVVGLQNGITITSANQGTIILSITGAGSFGTYVMEDSGLLPTMLDGVDPWWQSLSIASMEDAWAQWIYGGSAAECLKGAIALPCLFSLSGLGARTELVLGNYPTGLYGYPVQIPVVNDLETVAIPWQYNDWRRCNPYTKIYLYLPLIGTMSLNATELKNDNNLAITYALNITSGDLSVEIAGNETGRIIATASGNIAMATPYGSANISGAKVTAAAGAGIGGIAAVAAGAVTGGAAIVALGGSLAASASGLISAMQGESQGAGGLGGGASQALNKAIRCTTITSTLTDTQASLNPILGKPVMGKHQINSYGGFIQTDGMQVQGNLLDTERDAINALCDGGFYYE